MNIQMPDGRLYELLNCSECGVEMLLPKMFARERREDHKGWRCLNGHSQAFVGKSETEQLRSQLDDEKEKRKWAEKQKMAAALGKCPLC